MDIKIRPAAASDIEACGRIIYQAFKGIAERHGFPPDFPDLELAVRFAGFLIKHPMVYGLVAELDGRVVGSNFLQEHDAIRSVGPIAVDPRVQERGVGRRLMEAALERARGSLGVRLVQDSFNIRSLSLYASLGFEVKEPLALMRGRPRSRPPAEVEVRRLAREDLERCAALCKKVHGIERTNELRAALERFSPLVALRRGRITAYSTTLSVWGAAHGVAETEEDMMALILGAGASDPEPIAFLLPVRQANLFRWCLSEGLRVVKPMNLMAMGYYQEPKGCYFPSVFY